MDGRSMNFDTKARGYKVASWDAPIRGRRLSRLALILGAAVFAILGLIAWGAIALLFWLWGQFPTATEAGKRLAGEAMIQVEQVAPGATEQIGVWVPNIIGDLWGNLPAAADAGKRLADQTMAQIQQAAPHVIEQVGSWVPGIGAETPASDVSGIDIGPVPRFPGLVRSQFTRAETTVEVRYAGREAFEAVRAHYVKGFAAAGYVHEVMTATKDAEHHRFSTDRDSIEFVLMRHAGRVEVRLKDHVL